MTGKYQRQCSCTDCIYSIGLDQMFPQHLHEKGLRIDQLYYDEHLSLRERKLHDKYIKKKAIYDDEKKHLFPRTRTIIYNAKYARNHYGEMDDGDKRHKNSSFCTMDCLGDEEQIDQDPRDPYLKSKDELNDCQSCGSCSTLQPHRNADIINYHQAKPVNKIQTTSSSRLYAKRKQGDRSRKMRAVHFKTKYIRSEPCTCTIDLNESVNNRRSRPNKKKFKNVKSIPTTIESKAMKAKRCVCECNIIRKPNKSLQRLKSAKEKVKKSIRSSISKIENSFRIRKDSIMLFRDKLMRKQAMKKYECEPDYCIPENSPPKCYERIKMRLNNIKSEIKRSLHDLKSISSRTSSKTRPKNEKSISKKRSKSKPVICTCEPKIETTVSNEEEIPNIEKTDKKAFASKKKDSSSVKRNGLVIHIEPSIFSKKQSTKPLPTPKPPRTPEPPPTPKPKSSKHICECDKEEKRRKTSVVTKKSFRKTKPSFEYERYALDRNFPKECEASMCIPDECDLRKCAEILQAQSQLQDTSEYSSTHFSQKSGGNPVKIKSKHSQTIIENEHHAKSENIEPKRQAVHISSNFSFNIEFYKEQTNNEKGGDLPQDRIRKHKPRDEKSVSSKTVYSDCPKACNRNKSVQSKIKHIRSIKTNYSLKRCFCTVQLKDAPMLEKSSQSLKNKKIIPQTIGECDCETNQKRSTQTIKQKHLIDLPTPSLAPLGDACACDTCFDSDIDFCEFLSCKKRFREILKQNRKKRQGTENKSRKYSKGTTFPHVMTKTCKSQCDNLSKLSFRSTDTRNDINDVKHQKEHKEYESKIDNALNRSVVRIGSIFSFNIQFYKENEPLVDVTKKYEQFEHNYKAKHKIREIPIAKKKCRGKSTQSKFELTDRFSSTPCRGHFRTQKDQQASVDKAVMNKYTKEEFNNLSECNTTTQTPGQVANVTSAVLPPFSTSVKRNDFSCKRNIKQGCHVNGSKNKRMNTVDSCKSRTKSIKTLTDTGSSKRQMSLTKSIKTLPDTGSSKKQMSCQHRTLRSLSSKYFAPDRQEISPHRKVVSIGSSFSFNIEFYKDTSSKKQTRTTAGKGDDRNNNPKNKNRERKCQAIDIPPLHQPNKETKESCIKPFLDKCFCTLKLRKRRRNTIRLSNSKLQSKANTKNMKSRNCQCEIKRSTNPTLLKTKQSMAKVCYKSTLSGTSKSYIKNQKCQSKLIRPDSTSENIISSNTDLSENMDTNDRSESNKQVVRIGSSFSFNVEFFKEKGDAPSFNKTHPIVMDQRRKTNQITGKRFEDKTILLHSQKHKYCKKALKTYLTNDKAKTHLFKCSTRCRKHNKIDCQGMNTPKTINKSVIRQISKKFYIKNILETCKCDKAIKTRQKSCKHVACKIPHEATTCVPGEMKSETIDTYSKPIKWKSQKTQYIFYKPPIKNKYMEQPNFAMKTPAKQVVRISSNFGFNIEFNKQHSKPVLIKRNPKPNDFKIININKSETKRNNLKDRQSMCGNKNRKSSNIGLMLKHCLCTLKYSKQTKNEKTRNDNEKETQLNLPIPPKCQRYMCEKYVTANRKQPKAKSVLDMKGPCLKTKKVQSSFREHVPCTKKYSDQNIKQEKPKLKHRLQKSSSKKAVRMGSAFKFDLEFYKKYESPEYQEDRCSIKKHRRDTKEIQFNSNPNDELNTKKINDKRICGSCFQRHREYQVGYMKEEVTAMPGSVFQQKHQIWHMRVSDEELKNTTQIVNPVLINSNPFKRRYTKSNIKGKGKRQSKWRKKHVRFAVSNIETLVKNNYNVKPLNKNKRFRSEIYDTCFCNSYEVLQRKRSLLRAPSHAFSSSTKMPKKYFNLQSKQKKSKLIDITPSKRKMSRHKILKNLPSKHRKLPSKLKTTQTVVNSPHKNGLCCTCNFNRSKKTLKDLMHKVSNGSTWSSNKKTKSNPGLRKSKSTNVSGVLQQKHQVQPKQRNRLKIREKKLKPQRIQQIFHAKKNQKKSRLSETTDNYNEPNEMSFPEDAVLKNNEFGRQYRKSITYDACCKMKKISRILKSIIKFTILPKSRRFDGKHFRHFRAKNIFHKAGTEKCANEYCKPVIIETIKPYSKNNFRKRRSRSCLSKECKVLIKTTKKNYDKAKNLEIIRPISDSKGEGDFKKTKLYKLSQRFSIKRSSCHDICLKRARTNLLQNTQSIRAKKAFHVKQIVGNNEKDYKNSTNVGNLTMKEPCCVCCRQYSDTDIDKVQPKVHDESYLSKANKKLLVENKPSTQKPHVDNISKGKPNVDNISKSVSFGHKILNFLKGSIVKKTKSCECGSKICKSKLGTSLISSTKSDVICLCHHECECSATLKKAKKKKLKKKLKKENKQITKKRESEKRVSHREKSKLTKMYSQTPDSLLLAESCLDVTKISAGLIWNLIKVPYHAISNPKQTLENFKSDMIEPVDRAINIQQKIGAMQCTKTAKNIMESFTVANYLIHAFDDDPKKRLQAIKSKKGIKRKERIDFGCSPFMASLRKTPYLWVYDRCPTFYPQFISLLAGWRQFVDMLLFMLAIVVWSPCIFGIEMCRAIMCCCFCTG